MRKARHSLRQFSRKFINNQSYYAQIAYTRLSPKSDNKCETYGQNTFIPLRLSLRRMSRSSQITFLLTPPSQFLSHLMQNVRTCVLLHLPPLSKPFSAPIFSTQKLLSSTWSPPSTNFTQIL
jgi:hypothetical protein